MHLIQNQKIRSLIKREKIQKYQRTVLQPHGTFDLKDLSDLKIFDCERF